MGVLALMYHRTPREAGHILDVAMPLFRAQIQSLHEAGVRFIPFSQALDRRWYRGDTVVCITFDDGHESNLGAMEFLHEAGIPSTSFFVSDFVRRGQGGYMGIEAFRRAGELCEVGAHGATHTDLTSLKPEALEEELSTSKAYLERLSGKQVTAISVPGGRIDRRVVRAALKAGFAIIGDSKALLNRSPSLPLHRICVLNGQSPKYLVALTRSGSVYWLQKRLRLTIGATAARVLGDEAFGAVKRVFKGDGSG